MHADALHSTSARSIAGLAVGPLGLGCMNLSHAYGTPPAPPQAAAPRPSSRALDDLLKSKETIRLTLDEIRRVHDPDGETASP